MFAKILLPSDFSDCSSEAARAARRLAELFGSRLLVLHVMDEPAALDPMFRGEVPIELLRGRMETYCREAMERFVAAHLRDLPGVETRIVSGVPYREIIGTARECGRRPDRHRDPRPHRRGARDLRQHGREGGADGAVPRALRAPGGTRNSFTRNPILR